MSVKRFGLLCVFVFVLAACSPPTALETDIRTGTNDYRATFGRQPEGLSYNLQTSARDWANRLAYTGELEHSNLFLLLNKYPSLTTCGENLLSASGDFSAIQIVNAWKTSPPHDLNLLNSQYSMTGVGVVFDSRGGEWVVAQYCG